MSKKTPDVAALTEQVREGLSFASHKIVHDGEIILERCPSDCEACLALAALDALAEALTETEKQRDEARRLQDAIDLAAGYYRRELKEIIAHCSDDNAELAQFKIRVHAEEAVRAADGALAALAAGRDGGQ